VSTIYVKFTDLSTGAVLLGNGSDGWTPVDSDSFDQTLATDLAQGQASQTAPIILLPLADSGVAVQVQAAAAAGQKVQIEVASYDSSGRLTSDYLLIRSTVTSDQVTAGTGSSVQELTVQPSAYTSQTTSYDPGTGTPTTTDDGYGFLDHKPATTPVGAAPSDPSTLAASANTDAEAYSSVDTYVVLTDSAGKPVPTGSPVAFSGGPGLTELPSSDQRLSSYSGDVFEPNAVAYNLVGSGSATTASLFDAGPPNEASTLLFDMTLTGTQLKQIELFQTNMSNTGVFGVVSDTVLEAVTVTGVTFDLGDGGADGRITQFEAGAGTYTTSHETPAAAVTTKSVTLSTPASDAAGVAVVDNTRTGSIDYELTIQPYTGAATTTAISSARFAVTGDGPGTGAFSPLTITFDTMPDAAVLAALAAPVNESFTLDQNKHSNSDTSYYTFDALTFQKVQLSGSPVITVNGDGTSSYTYSFSVGEAQETFTQQQTDGAYTSSASPGFDQVFNTSTGQYDVEQDPACYCPGTLILTERGERPVETLAIGDRLVTASGDRRPVKWIGRRSYLPRFLAANPGMHPIRLRAGCLGGGLPRRDLLVSPEHAMLLDGLLMPARCLVNCRTVRTERQVDRLDYIHVELDSHDVIIAEGAPSETFVDDNSRGMFHNAQEFEILYPDVTLSSGGLYYARRVDSGPELEAVRRRMSDVAAAMALAA
jgi:hypothetical protein